MKVLVTTDGSDASWTVAPHAAAFARAAGASLVLVRVLDPLIDAGSVLATELETAVSRVSADWKAALETESARRGIEAEVVIRRLPRGKDIQDEICATADELGAVIIAIHAHGTGALRHAFVGSVAMGVVGKSRTPVMVTGKQAEPPSPPGESYEVAATTDGTESSAIILPHLQRLAEAAPAIGLVLIRVHDGDETSAIASLEEFRGRLPATMRVDLLPVRKSGNTAGEIIEAARGRRADAIAMATHGHGALRHLLQGSLAHDVLSRSPFPLILARTQ